MFKFKYNKRIDEKSWKRLIKNGIKFNCKFPTNYKITKCDILKAEKKAIEFQNIWNKYEKTFIKNISIIHDFPKNVAFYVNTSPYSYFNVSDNYVSISMYRTHNRVIPSILHECNHFLFKKYYGNFYSEDIKEIMTVINNSIFFPMHDGGWNIYSKQREKVLEKWNKTKNIKEVIKYAKKLAPPIHMKLIKITTKSITKFQLKKIYCWFNDQKMSKYLRTRHRTMKKIIEILSRRKTHNFMVNENGVDIGYIYITKKDDFISLTILIDKKYWGKGYGRQTMILIENEAKKLKAKKIIFGLYKENKRALNLYQGLGYIQTKEEKGNIIVMEKNL